MTAPEGDEVAAIDGVDGEVPVGISLNEHGQEIVHALVKQQDGKDNLAADKLADAAVGMGSLVESAEAPPILQIANKKELAPAPSSTPASAPTATIVDVRERTITYLRQKGGKCSLKAFSEDMKGSLYIAGGLDKNSPLYSKVLEALKEVTDTTRLPGESRPVLILKSEFAA